MIRLELAFGLVSICLLVFCLIEVIRTPEEDIRHLPKTMWLLLVLFFPFVGSVAWLVAGRPPKVAPQQRSTSGFPEYDRPGRAAASNPDDDADFLRQVRARAEEQRRKLEEQQKRERGETGETPAPEA